ncbi:MAG: hypothetical protein ACJ07L_04610 [Opitutales bacterium]
MGLNKVVLYGGSGGAILAITMTSKVGVACVNAGEPATVVPLDPKERESQSSPRHCHYGGSYNVVYA